MIMDVEVHECVSEYAEYMYDWFMSGKQEIRKQIMIMDSCKTHGISWALTMDMQS